MITLTRRYHFSASHRLHAPSLSARENVELFGKCNNPFGHGHNYVLSVTVAGDVDEQTGLIFSVQELDQLVQRHVLNLLAHRNLNTDVPQFREMVPSTENLTIFSAELLENAWPQEASAWLERVHVQETDRNGFELIVGARRALQVVEQEKITTHVQSEIAAQARH